MAKKRIVKDHDERRREILKTAGELFYAEGYANTTIQAIIDRIGIAKGTFYHYFSTKEELLEAFAEETGFAAVEQVREAVERLGGSAVEKLNRFYDLSTDWKAANADTFIAMTKTLYEDRNILLRARLSENGIRFLVPILASYIRQGVEEGLFSHPDPLRIAEMILRLKIAIGERAMPLFYTLREHPENAYEIRACFSLYQDSVERLLAVKPGTLAIFDSEDFTRRFCPAST